MVQGAVEDAATEGRRGKHAGDEGFEFDVAMVERWRDGPSELKLVGLEVVALAFAAVLALARFFSAGKTTDHGTEMSTPGAWTDGPDPTAVIADFSLAEDLDADDQFSGHFDVAKEHGGTTADEVGALATHPFLDLVLLLLDPRPVVVQRIDMYVDITQPVIVVGGVLVIDASFKLEPSRRDVGEDPFAIPYGVGRSSDGRRTKSHVRILFMPRWKTGVQLAVDIWIGRKRVEIGHWKTGGTVKGDLDGVAWGRVWYRGFIETSGGLGLFFCRATS